MRFPIVQELELYYAEVSMMAQITAIQRNSPSTEVNWTKLLTKHKTNSVSNHPANYHYSKASLDIRCTVGYCIGFGTIGDIKIK